MPVVRAGSLRTPLQLQKLTTTPDAGGGRNRSWQNVKIVRGRVRALNAEERMKAMQTESRSTHEITIRFRSDLVGAKTEEWRFVKGTRIFNIRGVTDEDERRWRMKIRVEEGVAT